MAVTEKLDLRTRKGIDLPRPVTYTERKKETASFDFRTKCPTCGAFTTHTIDAKYKDQHLEVDCTCIRCHLNYHFSGIATPIVYKRHISNEIPPVIAEPKQTYEQAKADFEAFCRSGVEDPVRRGQLYDLMMKAQAQETAVLNDFIQSQNEPYRRDLTKILGREPSSEELANYIANPSTPRYR